MRNILYFLILGLLVSVDATEQSTSIQAHYEIRDFKNSKQKLDGTNKVIELEHQLNRHNFKASYERTDTRTKFPIKEDLEVKKVFARYQYTINETWKLHTGFIHIDDNLVSTDGGKIYSLGTSYKVSKPLGFKLSAYYGDYDIMKTYQFDLKMVYKHQFSNIKSKTIIELKQINIRECQKGAICSNAEESYFTPGIKQSFSYFGNYVKAGAFFGKRTFAVMHDGFRVQHHAMEFDRTFMAGIGKKFNGFDASVNFIYQNAEELPMKNDDVEVRNVILSLAYSF